MGKERPILFSTPMVQAILEGRKTVTRRGFGKNNRITDNPDFYHFQKTLKGHVDSDGLMNKNSVYAWFTERESGINIQPFPCPYGDIGDILWVRETFASNLYLTEDWDTKEDTFFKVQSATLPPGLRWKPAIHMPKEAARIWLQITAIRVERLQGISESDAIKEGVLQYQDGTFQNYFTQKGLRESDGVECLLAKGSFQSLWCSINGLQSWDLNPWVWVVEFKVLSKTGKPQNL